MTGPRLLAGSAWEEVLRRFEQHLAVAPSNNGRSLGERTQQLYLRQLRSLGRAVPSGPWTVTDEDVQRWLPTVSTSPELRDKARSAARCFYAWAVREGHIERVPGTGLRDGWRQGHVRLGNGWDEAIAGFAEHLDQSTRTVSTCEGYLRHLLWLAESTSAGPWTLEVRELSRCMGAQASWSESTRRRVRTSLGVFYAWAVAEGLTEWAPVAGLQSPVHALRGPERLGFTPGWQEPGWAFLSWLRAGKRAEGTIDQRRWHLRKLSEVAADPWSVTTRQLQLWLSNPDWSPSSARTARTTLREFYRWAVLDGRVEESPALHLETIRISRRLPRPTPDGPLRAALAAADDRTRLILMLGALGGLRRAEIAALHSRDVSESEIFVTGKGGHQRRVAMHPMLWQEISVELARRRDGRHGTGWRDRFVTDPGYLFPSDTSPTHMMPKRVGELAAAALPDHWTAHTLRHRFATMAYAEQRDLLAVQQLLGHAKPETTARYAAVPDGALRTAVLGVTL